MINVLIDGCRVSYETLEDAIEASSLSSGLAFWRETIESCLHDSTAWQDLLNELWQSGGEREAETLHGLFDSPSKRRWALIALVLNRDTDPLFPTSIELANKESVSRLIEWLSKHYTRVGGRETSIINAELSYWQSRECVMPLKTPLSRGKGRSGKRIGKRTSCAVEQSEVRVTVRMPTYVVVDLAGRDQNGRCPLMFHKSPPSGGWTFEHRGTKLVLRRVNACSFMMGCAGGESGRDDDENNHHVNLKKPFYLGIFPITNRQWQLIMKTRRGSSTAFQPIRRVSYDDLRGADLGSQYPANLSVDDKSFMGILRDLTGCDGFDLPTEAQWECACRAGTHTPFSHGRCLFQTQANYGSSWKGPIEVGSYNPNPWGFYDMHGNVREWCLDWYGDYLITERDDPRGPWFGDGRVTRGGGWRSRMDLCRSASRNYDSPDIRSSDLGFRLCCSEDSVRKFL